MRVISYLIWTVFLLVEVTPLIKAQTLGMVANRDGSVTVFDADADVPLGGLLGLGHAAVGDCSVSADQSLGFVTDFEHRVWVIDLSDPAHPVLAGPPIPISNYGEDTSISPDGRYMVVCDGSALQPVSVVDIASRAEISTFFLGDHCNSAEVCSDGSVLVTTYYSRVVRRLLLDAEGYLTDTGEALFVDGYPMNAFCAPDSSSGLAVTGYPHLLQSFSLPGLVPLDSELLTGHGVAGQVNPSGDRVFARQTYPGMAWSFKYSLTTTDQLEVQFAIPVDNAVTYFGMDQLAVHPNGSKLYIPQTGSTVDVYDAETGNPLTTFATAGRYGNTGICFADTVAIEIDIKPGSYPNSVNCKKERGVIPVAILGSEDLDVASVDVTSLVFGPLKARPKHDLTHGGHMEDVDRDGFMDLVSHYVSGETGILCGDTEACLFGKTVAGTPFRGCDSLRTVGK